MLSTESLGSDAAEGQILPRFTITENAKKHRGADLNGSSFINSRVFTRTLDPSVKRYAQTKRFLAGSALGALKLLRDFTSAGLFPSQRLQGSHIRRRPRTPFSIFHDKLSPT